ncbi:MAG: hypothetical protein ABSE59_08180, partial [Opitutaceae bacterium]
MQLSHASVRALRRPFVRRLLFAAALLTSSAAWATSPDVVLVRPASTVGNWVAVTDGDDYAVNYNDIAFEWMDIGQYYSGESLFPTNWNSDWIAIWSTNGVQQTALNFAETEINSPGSPANIVQTLGPDFEFTFRNGSGNNAHNATLAYNTPYYYEITSYTYSAASGWVDSSATGWCEFTQNSESASPQYADYTPPCPRILYPGSFPSNEVQRTGTTTPTFTWDPVLGAKSYTLQLWNVNTLKIILQTSVAGSATSYKCPIVLPVNTT